MKILPLAKTPSLILALMAAFMPAGGANSIFNVPEGDFADPANWQGGLPSGFALTFIGTSQFGEPPVPAAVANLDTDVTSLATGILLLGQGSSGNGTLNILEGGSLQYGVVWIGRDEGAVGVINQTGGTNRVNTGVFEILSGGASGAYNLSGGVLNTVQAGPIAIKVGAFGAGTGYFNMSGGTFNAGSDPFTQEHSLNVGWAANGEATFSGGTANFTGDLNAGNGANGLVSISGSAEVNARDVNVGLQAGAANSQLSVSGGTLSVANSISVANSSALVVSGGSVTATGLVIASGSAVTNSGGVLNIPAITNNGTLSFDLADPLFFGGTLAGSGTYRVEDGTTLALDSGSLWTGGEIFVFTNGLVRFDGGTGTGAASLNAFGGTVDVNGQALAEGSWANLIARTPGAKLANSSAGDASIATGNTLWLYTAPLEIETVGNLQIDSSIISAFAPLPTGITKTGPGTLTLGGANTSTGNTTVAAGTLAVSPAGSLTFVIGAGGVNNGVNGSGDFVIDGRFVFNLSGASTNNGDSWTVVAQSLNETIYGANFAVDGFDGAAGTWTRATNGVTYQFEQSTGVLSVSGGAPAGNYANWLTNFPSLTGTNALGSADPDGDGFINDLEYAFDGNPTVGTPALMTVTAVGTNAVFNWVERTNGVIYEVQTSGNLTNAWTGPAAVTISNSTNQSGVLLAPEYVRREFVLPALGKNFYRVRATVLPE